MGRVFFFIGEGLRALRRSAAPSAAAIVTVGVTVVLLGALIPVVVATSGKTDEIRDQVGLQLFLKDGPDGAAPAQADVDALESRLQQIPHVQSVTYIDKDEALKLLSDRLKGENRADLTANLPGAKNPLPASFNVKPDDLSNLSSVRAAITPPGPDGAPAPISPIIDDIGENRNDAGKINSATTAIRIGLGIVSVLLLFTSLLLVGNTIRLSIYARRREVEVMRLVGATNWFIRWPFMVEGLLCGLIGGAAALGLLFLAKTTVVDPLRENFHLLSSGHSIAFAKLAFVLLAVAMGVSAMGSGLTLRRFLRV
jgi:cell division transport system permease protein